MKKVFIFIIFNFLGTNVVFGQINNCGNIGFEQGSFLGWQLSNGRVNDVNAVTIFEKEVSGVLGNGDKAGHLITSNTMGNDPLVKIEDLSVFAPGSKYSIRIGNSTAGAHFDRIKTSFLVGNDNTLFQYRFAIVLQDPSHRSYQQPAFSIKIFTNNNNEIPCGYYEVSAARGISGFKEQQGGRGLQAVTFRNWTTGAIDLSKFIGEVVNVEVTSNDCTEGGHFGYCYFDAQCLKSEITVSSFCPSDPNITLYAPEGFENYLWNTGEKSKNIKVKSEVGKKYSVKLKPFSSLNESCELNMDYVLFAANQNDTQDIKICEGDGYIVGDTTYYTSGNYNRKIPRNGLCDSLINFNLIVKPQTKFTQNISICEGETLMVGDSILNSAGTFSTLINRNGQCDSLVITNLTVKPLSRFSQKIIICEGEKYTVGDTTYQTSGIFKKLIKRNSICDSLVITDLTVKPLTRFSQSINICEGDSFTVGDTTYRTNGTFTKRIKRINMCDSLITTILSVIPLTKFTQKVAICEGESFKVGDTTYRTSGTFEKRFKRRNLCDSLVTTILTVIRIQVNSPKVFSMILGDSVLIAPLINPTGSYNYNWSPNNNISCSSCPSVYVNTTEDNTFLLRLENIDFGCKKEFNFSVVIKLCPLYIPNIFTPNADGNNDTFYPFGNRCVKEIKQFMIYNRWGELIFAAFNFPHSDSKFGWDGSYKNQEAPSDSYTYKLIFELINQKIVEQIGSVVIQR